MPWQIAGARYYNWHRFSKLRWLSHNDLMSKETVEA
jgi:hypothetical protein